MVGPWSYPEQFGRLPCPAVVFAVAALNNYQVFISSTSTPSAPEPTSGSSARRDLPAIREGNVNRGQRDGALAGLNLIGERRVGINYRITRTTGGAGSEARVLAHSALNLSHHLSPTNWL